jgi:hypothetical protein
MPTEHERLRRLRERQLAARDPQTRGRRLHREISVRRRRSTEPLSVGRIWSEIPAMWKGGAFWFGLGTVLVALLSLVRVSPWSLPCAATATLFFSILGLLIGRAFDTRDSPRDLLR